MQNTKYGKGLKKLTDDHTKAKDAILQVFILRNYTTYINFGHYYNSHVQTTRRSFRGLCNNFVHAHADVGMVQKVSQDL